ncbi:hypothetical protein HMPREF1051_2722 [Neisseria sicca VK64]|uniref:Uncharacterized protein n=1 Tax=Neisseria sicca VK64 TaxID=1095748 RepID=I2NS02_NEISI|nr:hypothetical protein HMPREF1051_2722 [Neisseria sicca VK64]
MPYLKSVLRKGSSELGKQDDFVVLSLDFYARRTVKSLIK